MARKRRIIAPNMPHHIVQRCINKLKVFHSDTDYRVYLARLAKYSSEMHVKVYSYCLMSNHVHLLLIPQNKKTLADFMKRLSGSFIYYINKKNNRTGGLWESRYYSNIVDTDQYLWAVCRYIERNPVRACMIDSPEKYKWSSEKHSLGIVKDKIITERKWFTESQSKQFKTYLLENDDLGLVKETVPSKML